MSATLRGVPVASGPLWLDPKLPGDTAQYFVPLDPDDVAQLLSLTVAAAPSGTGEITLSALEFADDGAYFVLAGGQPGRTYTILLTANREDGAVSSYVTAVRVDAVLLADQPQLAPSAGFGATVTWTPQTIISGSADQTMLTAAGTTWADATTFTARLAIFTIVPSNTGGRPYAPTLNVEYQVLNRGANDMSLYPPGGGTWEGQGINVPVTLPAGGAFRFVVTTLSSGYIY